MPKWELYSAAIGALGGAVTSLVVAYLFVNAPSLWLAAILGALTGATGGAFGQNFIEGIVAAVMCIGLLALFLTTDAGGLFKEIMVGLCCGEAFGWLTHGIFKDLIVKA